MSDNPYESPKSGELPKPRKPDYAFDNPGCIIFSVIGGLTCVYMVIMAVKALLHWIR